MSRNSSSSEPRRWYICARVISHGNFNAYSLLMLSNIVRIEPLDKADTSVMPTLRHTTTFLVQYNQLDRFGY